MQPSKAAQLAFVRRVWLVEAVLLLGFVVVLLRSAQLQVDQHERLSRLAREQYQNTVTVPARRGQIFDRNRVPLAVSVEVPSIFANPAAIEDVPLASRKLARVLGLDAAVIESRLQSERYFVWLKRQVAPAVSERVRALGLAGVGISHEQRRFYPNRDLAAQVLGFVGLDGHGLDGIEHMLDAQLSGTPQKVHAVRDAHGQALLSGLLDATKQARGEDIVLTLDSQLQQQAEEALGEAMRATGAKSASAIILEIPSGDVLALAQVPGYNPNAAAQVAPSIRRNRLVTDVYEPGSTLKPMVVAAALQAGVVHADQTLYCEQGQYTIGRHTIRDTHAYGNLSLTDVVAKSSNIGMAKLAGQMGRQTLDLGLRRFGLAQRTGIELPGEAGGLMRPYATWSELENATIAFGQGVAVGGLQLAAAFQTLAAGGVYTPPRLVRANDLVEQSRVRQASRAQILSAGGQVVDAAVAGRVTEMLEQAVLDGGTGRLAQVPGYRVAGKTGTAQKADVHQRGYSLDKYTALFAGYLPAEAPRAVIVVAVDEPRSSHFGGTVAAPVFSRLGALTMRRLEVPMHASRPASPPSTRPSRSASLAPKEGAQALAAIAKAASADARLPDLRGLLAPEAAARVVDAQLEVHLEFRGTGAVVSQEFFAPQKAGETATLRLTLAP